jgi:hypothetical protein
MVHSKNDANFLFLIYLFNINKLLHNGGFALLQNFCERKKTITNCINIMQLVIVINY